ELSPFKSSRRLAWVEFKIKTGALGEAKRILEEMNQKAPDYLAASVYLAKIAFAESKYDDCSALLDKVLARDPTNFDALLLRGRLKLARGQSVLALAELERLAKQYPYVPQAHLELAIAQLRNNDPTKAIASLRQAIRLDPELVDAVVLLGELSIRKGD